MKEITVFALIWWSGAYYQTPVVVNNIPSLEACKLAAEVMKEQWQNRGYEPFCLPTILVVPK